VAPRAARVLERAGAGLLSGVPPRGTAAELVGASMAQGGRFAGCNSDVRERNPAGRSSAPVRRAGRRASVVAAVPAAA